MRNVNLEENELTITAIFQQHTKEETIQTLKEALEVLEQEESDHQFYSWKITADRRQILLFSGSELLSE